MDLLLGYVVKFGTVADNMVGDKHTIRQNLHWKLLLGREREGREREEEKEKRREGRRQNRQGSVSLIREMAPREVRLEFAS